MFELVQVGAQSDYIESPAKIGVYDAGGGCVYLIDSGNDTDAGRKVRQVLDRQGWTLAGILSTHSNADHIGGNRYWQGQTGCKVFANGVESAFTRHPLLEPAFLYGGYPCADLRHKFLLAQDSEPTAITDPAFPAEIGVIPLPGHFWDMVGYRTPDDTVFLADCLSSEATLEKYGIPFIFDVQRYLETLDAVTQMRARMFVPAHAPASAEVAALARYNRDKVLAVAERLLAVCHEPVTFEDALAEMFSAYGLSMNFEQYVLVGSTVRSFLSWLRDAGRVSVTFADNRLRWQAV